MSPKEKLKDKILELVEEYYQLELNDPLKIASSYIPVSGKKIDSKDLKFLIDSCLDMHFTSGRFTKKFEEKLAKKNNVKQKALFVNSGSSANLLALSSLCQNEMMLEFGLTPLKPGDEVITSAAGFPTTVNPIFQNNLIPKFIDTNLDTLNPDLDTIFSSVTKKTKAIFLAHTLGNPFRADIVREYCDENKIYLIEDCCDGFGSKIFNKGKTYQIGQFGEYSTLSFYPAHHITTGEGGAVFSLNSKFRRIAESVRDWGRHCWCDTGKDNTCKKRFAWDFDPMPEGYDHKYIYSSIGYNLKATDMQAALGCSQIEKLDSFVKKRKENWNLMRKIILEDQILKTNFSIMKATEDTDPSWFGFGLRCLNNINRNRIVQFLEKNNIGNRLLFAGNLIKQPAYKNKNYKIYKNLTNTETIMKDFFWVGIHPKISENDIYYITDHLKKIVKNEIF